MKQALNQEGLSHYHNRIKKYINARVNEGIGESIDFVFSAEATEFTIKVKGSGTCVLGSGDNFISAELGNDENQMHIPIVNHTVALYLPHNIIELDVSSSQIESITFPFNESIKRLKLQDNYITSIDFSNLQGLKYLHIYNNPIVDNCLQQTDGVYQKFSPSIDATKNILNYNIVGLTDTDAFANLSSALNTLPSRTNKSLGSIILYPWYGLETLIYKADGYHYKMPALDFTAIPSDKVDSDILCKYPRRLRFLTTSGDCYIVNETGCDINESCRKSVEIDGTLTTKEYFTDEPLENTIYNNPDDLDTHRSLKQIVNGIEFNDESSDNSILYALVENYGFNSENAPSDVTSKNTDKNTQWLHYVTYTKNTDNTLIEKEHPLTQYNLIRSQIEKVLSEQKNWFFGSAIQDTEEYNHCPYYFKKIGCQNVWESAQKGFGRTISVLDSIAGINPQWNHLNIMRFQHAQGGAVAITSYENNEILTGDGQLYHSNPAVLNGNYDHGEQIVSYLSNRGNFMSRYGDAILDGSLYGICPNATLFLTDQKRRNITGLTLYAICKDMFDYTDVSTTSLDWYQWDRPALDRQTYACRYYTGRFGEKGFITHSAGNNGDSCEATTDTRETVIKDGIRYRNDGCVAVYGKYGDYFTEVNGLSAEFQSFSNDASGDAKYYEFIKDLPYHSTAYHTASISAGNTADYFSNGSSSINHTYGNVEDYLCSYGSDILGYRASDGILVNNMGTSMSAPISAGTMALMINIYKCINAEYKDTPTYNGGNEIVHDGIVELSSSIDINSEDQLVHGGYGKFSLFMDHAKKHWMYKPIGMMEHFCGLGIPNFVNTSGERNDSGEKENVNLGSIENPLRCNVSDIIELPFVNTPHYYISNSLQPNPNSSKFAVHQSPVKNIGLIKDKQSFKIVPIRPFNNYHFYVCNNISSFGKNTKLDVDQNTFIEPQGFDTYFNTYHYYDVYMTSNSRAISSVTTSLPINIDVGNGVITTNTIKSGNSFTVQMLMKYNVKSLLDVESVNGNFNVDLISQNTEYGLLLLFMRQLTILTDPHSTSTSQNVLALDEITNTHNTIGLAGNNVQVISNTNYIIPKVRRIAALTPYLDIDDEFVFTFIVKDNILKVYINGLVVGSIDSRGLNLNKIKINGMAIGTDSIQEFIAGSRKYIIITDYAMTDAQIVGNVAYLLNQEENNI